MIRDQTRHRPLVDVSGLPEQNGLYFSKHSKSARTMPRTPFRTGGTPGATRDDEVYADPFNQDTMRNEDLMDCADRSLEPTYDSLIK